MKDYYKAFVTKNSQKRAGTEVSKVPKGISEVETGTFETFVTDLTALDLEIIREERIAVMMFDGGLSEEEAKARCDHENS